MEANATSKYVPKPYSELMPLLLEGMRDKEGQALGLYNTRRTTAGVIHTGPKTYKPRTMAEMKAEIEAMEESTKKKTKMSKQSVQKKPWNSSVKVNKTVSHTRNGQLKDKTVKKMLCFTQPKPKSRMTSVMKNHKNLEMSSTTKQIDKPKKSFVKGECRVSGVEKIQETPSSEQPIYKRKTIDNKENICVKSEQTKKISAKANKIGPKTPLKPIHETPVSTVSWKLDNDSSFLQMEKEINAIEVKTRDINKELMHKNIAEITSSISTPFKEYNGNVMEFFNNTSAMDCSNLCCDETIMRFPTQNSPGNKVENDPLNEAQKNHYSIEADELEVRRTEYKIRNYDNIIQFCIHEKQIQLEKLKNIKRKITKRKNLQDKALISVENDQTEIIKSPISNRKLASYKIPKKNSPFKKNSPLSSCTPNRNNVHNMYMKMKHQMNFLHTPRVNSDNTKAPDTPAVTSHNLQMQLGKLYDAD